jgi:hypothetical protein
MKGNVVDRFCLELAHERGIPMISWEGHGPTGLDATKLIPSEARARRIDLVTPEELLRREKFEEGDAIKRFFTDWREHAPRYVAGAQRTRLGARRA